MTHITPPDVPRSPWQRLYGAAHRWRRRYYQKRAARLPRPVLSVGNLHWGGSGKTPLTAAVAAHLRDAGRAVAILSRGYGRRDAGKVRVVSDGEGPLLGPQLAGDEPVLLAGLLPGVAVVVGAERSRAGLHALERLRHKPDVFVLDDGFSHVRLARDLDLLVFPAADPFGGGRLAPSGRLREPLASAAHADAVILSATPPHAMESAGHELARALRRHGFAGPGFASRLEAAPPSRVGRGAVGREEAPVRAGTRVLLVSAIARPAVFFETAREFDLDIAEHLVFPDHHAYPEASREKIVRVFGECGAELVLMTGKDRVKLQGHLDLPLAEVPVRAVPEANFFTWLDHRLEEIEA